MTGSVAGVTSTGSKRPDALFGGEVPDITARYDEELIAAVYDDNGRVIWPS